MSRAIAPWMVLVGGATMAIGTLLPWVTSGASRRNSYELFAIVDRLGLAPDGAAGVVLRWWALAPLVLSAAIVAWWWRRRWSVPARWVVSVVLVAASIATAVVAWAVATAPVATSVTISAGPTVTVAGAMMVALGVAAESARQLRISVRATAGGPRAPAGASLADRS